MIKMFENEDRNYLGRRWTLSEKAGDSEWSGALKRVNAPGEYLPIWSINTSLSFYSLP